MSADKQTRPRKPRKSRSDFQRLSSRFMSSLLKSLFLINKPTRAGQTGFVLPTTVLLLLMVTLTVGAMSFRTFSRTEQTIAYRNQQVIDSLSAPAVDRAKAKIEFLFTKDASVVDKRPPSSSDLLTALAAHAATPLDDPYTFTSTDANRGGETRLDTDGNAATFENVWSFVVQDGTPGGTQVVYSIVLDDKSDSGAGETISIDNGSTDQQKADSFVVRNGPIDTNVPSSSCPVERLAGNGWQLAGGQLAKNIQVDVVAIKGSGSGKTVSASEYQQVRTASRGNLWGAWFRYDMEIFPGEPLRWNGAMHTEGSLLAGSGFTAYMVSSANSCIYDPDASVIEVSGPIENEGSADFLGQVVAGVTGKLAADGPFLDSNGSIFHTDAVARDTTFAAGGAELLSGSDSVTTSAGTNASDISQDPISIFTEDRFHHKVAPSSPTEWDRDDAVWSASDVSLRIRNDDGDPSARPFLDDGYRADNRYGPKPKYNDDYVLDSTHSSGTKIAGVTALTSDTNTADNGYGLDGYWERSAANTGLRLVVGQRLELGNRFGWEGNEDPLYPPSPTSFQPPVAVSSDPNQAGRQKGPAETIQMRSLRDNLAAVQSMVIYHSAHSTAGSYPLACIASTSHPGTQKTLEDSRTFEQYEYVLDGSQKLWRTNFLTGSGTNGIEFDPPPIADFTGGIASDWTKALSNLAYFAGDPKGGAPSFPAEQESAADADSVVHPYPYMSMWGDFSILRRIFTDSAFNYLPATNYDSLSPADRSTIDTAACTLGMLAYNLESVEKEGEEILKAHITDMTSVMTAGSDASQTDIEALGTIEERLNAINTALSADGRPELTDTEKEDIILYRQVRRDRKFGFIKDNDLTTSANSAICSAGTFISVTASPSGRQNLRSLICSKASEEVSKYPSLFYLFPVSSHDQESIGSNYEQPTTSEEFFSVGGVDYINSVNSASSLYKAVEPSTIALNIRAPGSWKLPKATVTPTSTPNAATPFEFSEAGTPEFGTSTTTENYDYQESYGTTVGKLPSQTARNLTRNVVRVRSSSGYDYYRTSLLDKAMMDGRELLSVRLMDLDIDLLTDTTITNGTVGGKSWIPADSGVVYAFREDAVREDAIVRPNSSAWSVCKDFGALTTNSNCYMSVDPRNDPQDPPLNDATKISPKAVDMYADPLRRPHGFRLINGESLHRTAADSSDPVAGMTFVTDNTVYIKGDFNLHADITAGTTGTLESRIIEEFKEDSPGDGSNLLGTAFANFSVADESDARELFYGRDNLDNRFADPTQDNWRPVEIFADGITILSDLFIDGWIEDGFVTVVSSSPGRGKPPKNSSYLNWNRPWNRNDLGSSGGVPNVRSVWRRESSPTGAVIGSSTVASEIATPVRVDRNGNAHKRSDAGRNYPTPGPFLLFPQLSGGRYLSFYRAAYTNAYNSSRQSQQNKPNSADPVRINALFVGGIVPSRPGQSYGGLHNFPRLLEFWGSVTNSSGAILEDSKPLIISGGFFQLNFSSQAVAPFDQDAWEPGVAASSDKRGGGGNWETIKDNGGSIDTKNQVVSNHYYGAAKRIWGYDVAFQYSPAGPIARRFVQVDRPRSEFFRELPVDDPYIKNLCNAGGVDC